MDLYLFGFGLGPNPNSKLDFHALVCLVCFGQEKQNRIYLFFWFWTSQLGPKSYRKLNFDPYMFMLRQCMVIEQ